MTVATWATADLCDAHPGDVQVVTAIFRNYGGAESFRGTISTVRVHEDYRPVMAALGEPGAGRVLVVDGGGSVQRAILGERLLGLAHRNGWAGVLIHGAVRDTALTAELPIGLRALGTVPMRGESGGPSERDVPLECAGVVFRPGEQLWADADGIVVGAAGLGTEGPP